MKLKKIFFIALFCCFQLAVQGQDKIHFIKPAIVVLVKSIVFKDSTIIAVDNTNGSVRSEINKSRIRQIVLSDGTVLDADMIRNKNETIVNTSNTAEATTQKMGNSPSLEYNRYGFVQNGQAINQTQAEGLLKTNPRAFDWYNQGKQNNTIYKILGRTSVATLGLMFLLPQDTQNNAITKIGVGVVSIVTSIAAFAVQSTVKYKFAQAAAIYNAGNKVSFFNPKPYYGINQNGHLALGLKF